MRKTILALLILTLLLPAAGVAETVPEFNDVPYRTVDLAETDENYYSELDLAELWNWKQIRNYPTLYTKESWQIYLSACSRLQNNMDHDNLTDENKADLNAIKAAREALVQVKPFEGINGEVIYLWENDMPVTTPKENLVFAREDYDNEDFLPFMIPYLVEDQSQAKGVWVIASGGGNNFRSNPAEGYNTCPRLNELGYNAFLVQRRVYPYNSTDYVLDLQRAIRCVKAHAEEWGLGGMDVLVEDAYCYTENTENGVPLLDEFYGHVTPDLYDADYVCDEIDLLSSDFDVAVFIHWGKPLNEKSENENIPHMFIGVGEDEGFAGSMELFSQMKSDNPHYANVNPELHIFGQTGHGFGAGVRGTSSILWLDCADQYIQGVMGKAKIIVPGDPPDEFVLKQIVIQNDTSTRNMDMYVSVYTTAEHDRYYFAYITRGNEQIVYGNIVDGIPQIPSYDSSGGYAARYGAHTTIWGLVDPDAWEPR